MNERPGFEELGARLREALRDAPPADIEKNLRVLLGGLVDRFELVTREDFDVQRKLLARAHDRLAALERRLAQFEASGRGGGPAA